MSYRKQKQEAHTKGVLASMWCAVSNKAVSHGPLAPDFLQPSYSLQPGVLARVANVLGCCTGVVIHNRRAQQKAMLEWYPHKLNTRAKPSTAVRWLLQNYSSVDYLVACSGNGLYAFLGKRLLFTFAASLTYNHGIPPRSTLRVHNTRAAGTQAWQQLIGT